MKPKIKTEAQKLPGSSGNLMDLDIERDFQELHPKSRARLVIDDAPITVGTGGIDLFSNPVSTPSMEQVII